MIMMSILLNITSEEMAQFLMELYQSDKVVGLVDVTNFEFHLSGPLLKH